MADISELGVKVNTGEATRSIDGIGSALERLDAKATAVTSALRRNFLGVSAALVAMDIGRRVVRESTEAQYAFANLEAAIRSTGGAAGFTASELGALSEELSALNNVTDTQAQKVQSLLLLFSEIRGDVFKEATQSAINMGARLGGLESAATQLGKALQDPEQGLSALRRAGVSFSDAQEKMIVGLQKSGDLMAAQRLILSQLEFQFGGASRAARDTLGGAISELTEKFNKLFELDRESAAGIVAAINDISKALGFLRERLEGVGSLFKFFGDDLTKKQNEILFGTKPTQSIGTTFAAAPRTPIIPPIDPEALRAAEEIVRLADQALQLSKLQDEAQQRLAVNFKAVNDLAEARVKYGDREYQKIAEAIEIARQKGQAAITEAVALERQEAARRNLVVKIKAEAEAALKAAEERYEKEQRRIKELADFQEKILGRAREQALKNENAIRAKAQETLDTYKEMAEHWETVAGIAPFFIAALDDGHNKMEQLAQAAERVASAITITAEGLLNINPAGVLSALSALSPVFDTFSTGGRIKRHIAELTDNNATIAKIPRAETAALAAAAEAIRKFNEAVKEAAERAKEAARAQVDLDIELARVRGDDATADAIEAERRYTDAVEAGRDAKYLATLQEIEKAKAEREAAEAAAEAAKKAEELRRSLESFVGRALSLIDPRAGEDFTLRSRQRQELADADPTQRALISFVHFVETAELAMRRMIEDGSKAIQETLTAQLAGLDIEQKGIEDALKKQLELYDRQIDAIRAQTKLQLEAIDAQIEATEAAAEREQRRIEEQIDLQREALDVAREQLREAESQAGDLRRVLDSLKSFGSGLSTGGFSPLSPLQQYELTRRQLESASAEDIPAFAQRFLEASRAVNASGAGYVADFQRVQQIVAQAIGAVGGQLSEAERQAENARKTIAGIEKQIEELQKLRETVRDEARTQIDELRKNKEAVQDSAQAQIDVINAAKEQARIDAQAQLDVLNVLREQYEFEARQAQQELIDTARAQFDALVQSHEFYDDFLILQETANSDAERHHQESVNEQRLANIELRAAVGVLTDGFNAVRGELEALRAEMAENTRSTKDTNEAVMQLR